MKFIEIRTLFLASLLSVMFIPGICRADYIADAKNSLFDGTLQGLRDAHQSCKLAMEDNAYPKTRQLYFLHAFTRSSMIIARDDGGDTDSFLELAREYGFELIDDTAEFNLLDLDYPVNNRDTYELPEDAPDAEYVEQWAGEWLLPELEDIIDTLELIESPDSNKFELYFTSVQTGMEMDLRIGYGEVLIFKGMLSALKANLTSSAAYDTEVTDFDALWQKIFGGAFLANDDLLYPNPHFLELLQAEGSENRSGADVLAQAGADMVDALTYYIDAIEYIKNDEFSQTGTERLLYFDYSDIHATDAALNKLTLLRNSLRDDTAEEYTIGSSRTFELNGDNFNEGTLVLDFDLLNTPTGGTLEVLRAEQIELWEVSDVYQYNGEFAELELERVNDWGGGYMSLNLIDDGEYISGGSAYFWSSDGDLTGITGSLLNTSKQRLKLDINPIYGSTYRYRQPVSIRELLPEFSRWNTPLPGTVGAGLGYDATLGGILPEFTQHDWQTLSDLQPAGALDIPELQPGQEISDDYSMNQGIVAYWLDEQLIFEDISDDTQTDDIGSCDIKDFYMGYGEYGIYGEITFHDPEIWQPETDAGFARGYEIIFSYSPDEAKIAGSRKIVLKKDSYGYVEAELYRWEKEGGCRGSWWSYGNVSATTLDRGTDGMAIQFAIDRYGASLLLSGKFLTINSHRISDMYITEELDENETHLQFGPLGNAYGNVAVEGFAPNMPIIVEAFTDRCSPDETVVASTRIDHAGDFVLEGIGLGWKGYIRAFMPVFGFKNPLEADSIQITDIVKVNQWNPEIYNIGLTLKYPPIIILDEPVESSFDLGNLKSEFFAFDAIEGAGYNISMPLNELDGAIMTIYARDGKSELEEYHYWSSEGVMFIPPVSGRYYIEIEHWDYQTYIPETVNFTLLITSNTLHFSGDIANENGIGAKDAAVNLADLQALLACWLQASYAPEWCHFADITGDEQINAVDYSEAASQWLQEEIISPIVY